MILDNGHLTKACDTRWGGVDVYGHAFVSQYFAGSHGTIELLNGSSIQNAERGIQTLPNIIEQGSPLPGVLSIVKIHISTTTR